MRTCSACGALFESLNPLRKHCDNCREREKWREELTAFHDDPYDLAPLANVPDEAAAAEMIARLEAADIPAVRGVHGRFIRDALLDGELIGRLQVLVRNSDYDRACEVLDLDDEELDPRDSDLVVLLNAESDIEARILVDQLEQYKIPAVLGAAGQAKSSLVTTHRQVHGPLHQVLVRAADFDPAREILGLPLGADDEER